MNCIRCTGKAVKDKLCRTHYIESKEVVYRDNSNLDDMGIVRWCRDMYPEHYRSKVPKFHLPIYRALLNLYNGRYINKYERLLELISFRGSAKSKIIFGVISYIICHNGQTIKILDYDDKIIECKIKEKLVVIASETGTMAEDFVSNIRDEFTSNEMIRYFYHLNIQDALDEIDGQWTKKAFKINSMFVLGIGQGMQIRGRIKGAYRPTFIFFDDCYSENNSSTEDGRKKIKRWFNNAAMNTLDDLDGKAFLVGTIVHEDTIVVECEKNEQWKTIKHPVMSIVEFKRFIKEHIETDHNRGWCKLPFENLEEYARIERQREYFTNIQNERDWGLAWPERCDLYFLALKYKESMLNSSLDGFYQEYFHETISSESKRFKPEYFQKTGEFRIFNEFGYNWMVNEKYYGDKPQMINIEFGVDTSGGRIDGDDTVIAIKGRTADKRTWILDIVYGKFSIRDSAGQEYDSSHRMDRVISDKAYIAKIGFVDECYRLAQTYKPLCIKIGIAGTEVQYVDEMRRVFEANGDYTTSIEPLQQTLREGKKEERITNVLLARYETMSVFHKNGLEKLETQLEFLGKGKHDDLPDAVANACINEWQISDIPYDTFKQVIKKKSKFALDRATLQQSAFDWRC